MTRSEPFGFTMVDLVLLMSAVFRSFPEPQAKEPRVQSLVNRCAAISIICKGVALGFVDDLGEVFRNGSWKLL